MNLHIDNSMITSFRRCKEEFRQKWLMNRVSAFIPIHQVFGKAMHKAVELLWYGEKWEVALNIAMALMTGEVHASDKKRWEELKDALPDCIACYSDTVDVSQKPLAIEQQFTIGRPFGIDGVTAVGRIDRVHSCGQSGQRDCGPDTAPEPIGCATTQQSTRREGFGTAGVSDTGPDTTGLMPNPLPTDGDSGPVSVRLVDSKTAAEIDSEDVFGKKCGWERSYKEKMLLDSGLAMYDWALRQMGYDVKEIQLEVILKPYPRFGKKAKVIYIDMPEIIAYRERHDQQLWMTLVEMRDYIERYREVSPWPMTDSACQSKYGWCDFASICRYGPSPRILKLYQIREEHLEIGERIR